MRNLLISTFRILSITGSILAALLLITWIAVARPVGKITAPHPFSPSNTLITELESHVRVLSEDIPSRSWDRPEDLDKAADYIRQQWENMGLTVEDQLFEVRGNNYRNVTVTFESGKGQPAGKIIIGAHYDSAHNLPGADDNASGTAGLIELARMLKDMPLKTDIELVAFSLEEPPMFGTHNMGSFFHAERESKRGTKIDLMISLEMIGYFSEEPNSQDFPLPVLKLFYPNKGNFIGVVDKLSSRRAAQVKRRLRQATDLPIHSINGPAAIQGVNYSDHLNYWHFGYDAVMVTDTSFYRNKAYHKKEDTADRLNYEKMAKVVGAVAKYVESYAEATQ